MPHRPPSRLPFVAAAGVAAALIGAAPALASEGPPGPPPLPTGTAPVVIPPLPSHGTPGLVQRRPVIRRARLVPRRLHHGRRATLRLRVSGAARLRIVIRRMSRPGRGRFATVRVVVVRGKLALRLPRRAHGKRLAAGRYRISIVAVNAQGTRSRTVRRTLVVLR